MVNEAKSAVVEFAMRSIANAVHEEARGLAGCRAVARSGFICSRPDCHEGPHIAVGAEMTYHIWQSWEEKE